MGSKKISQLTENTNPSLSGVTIFDDGISSYKVSLQTLKDTIVEETTNYFTGSQVISGSLNVLNSVTASFFVGNGSQLTNLPFSVSGSGSNMAFFHTSTHITSSNDFHLVNGNETLALGTDAYTLSNPERLMVDNGGINIATFQHSSEFNNYSQLNIKNFSSGSEASADLTLWNDVTTEDSTYVNLGINSSQNSGNNVGFAGDGYLFNDTHDMYIGSLQSNVHLFSAGQSKFPAISIFSDRSIGFNIDQIVGSIETIPSSVDDFLYEFSGSVKLNNDFKVDGFTILAEVSASLNFADDSSAAAGGVPLGGLYRTDNVIKIRLV